MSLVSWRLLVSIYRDDTRLASPCLIPCNRSSWLQLLTSFRPAADDDVDFELVVDVICAAECWVSVGPRLPVSEGSTADPFHDVESTLPPVFISVSHPDHKQLIIFLSPNNSKSRRVFCFLSCRETGIHFVSYTTFAKISIQLPISNISSIMCTVMDFSDTWPFAFLH